MSAGSPPYPSLLVDPEVFYHSADPHVWMRMSGCEPRWTNNPFSREYEKDQPKLWLRDARTVDDIRAVAAQVYAEETPKDNRRVDPTPRCICETIKAIIAMEDDDCVFEQAHTLLKADLKQARDEYAARNDPRFRIRPPHPRRRVELIRAQCSENVYDVAFTFSQMVFVEKDTVQQARLLPAPKLSVHVNRLEERKAEVSILLGEGERARSLSVWSPASLEVDGSSNSNYDVARDLLRDAERAARSLWSCDAGARIIDDLESRAPEKIYAQFHSLMSYLKDSIKPSTTQADFLKTVEELIRLLWDGPVFARKVQAAIGEWLDGNTFESECREAGLSEDEIWSYWRARSGEDRLVEADTFVTTLIEIREKNNETVSAYLPGWDDSRAYSAHKKDAGVAEFKLIQVPSDMQSRVEKGAMFSVRANVSAERPQDLRLRDFEFVEGPENAAR